MLYLKTEERWILLPAPVRARGELDIDHVIVENAGKDNISVMIFALGFYVVAVGGEAIVTKIAAFLDNFESYQVSLFVPSF